MNKDLTVGTPWRVLLAFCVPLLGSVLFQQLYNIADSLVAGKFIGENALAAVGNSYEITLIFLAFAMGCNIGISVIVSQLFGARQYNDMKTAVYTAMIACGVLCAALMVFGLMCGGWLLECIETPEIVFTDSKLYLDIYILGLPFLFFYNVSTGIFSALGDSKTPFWFLACSSTANIAVDILFVTAFDMGVAGVAWATFLCQGISCVLAVSVILHRLKGIPTEGAVPVFSLPILKRLAIVAVPSIIQQGCISVGNVLIQGVINGFGPGVMAGYASAIKLNNLVITSLTTLGNGISNFTAQNIGAGKTERISQGHQAGLAMVWCLCLPIVVLYVLAGEQLVGFFMDDPSREAIAAGVEFLTIVSPFYMLISLKLATDGVLRGAGRMNEFMVATLIDLAVRVVLAMILPARFGTAGIWAAWPLGWAVGVTLSVLYYRKGPWLRENPSG